MILAGGHSRRFGSDKVLARWRGRTFLEQVHDAVSAVAGPVHVLARADHAGMYRHLVPCPVLPDTDAFAGPVAALRRGLPPSPRVLVASVDAPGLRVKDLQRLVETGRDRIAVATVAGRPLHGLFTGPRRDIEAGLRDAERLGDVTHGAVPVTMTGPDLNINEVSGC